MPGFFIHRSNRVERLAAELGDLLAEPLGGPLDAEAVVVQGRGMEIWLGGELARRFGVWAQPMRYPRELVETLVRDVLGADALGERPLSESLLGWTVHALLPELLAEPELAALARYVHDDTHGTKTAELAARIATVFDQYLTYRPDWVRAWEGGDLSVLPDGQRWQGLLWQRVVARVGRAHLAVAAERLVARLGEAAPCGARVPGVPPRVLAFGLTTLPPLYVRVLVALSRQIDVHLFSFSPSPQAWAPSARGAPAGGHRLLGSLGALGMDFQRVLASALAEAGVEAVVRDLHEPPGDDTLLGRVQAELFAPADGARTPLPPEDDPSIVVHSCHGPMREVEVLHDQLMALLTRKDDPVRPEDVIVLMPDLDTYAPLVEAVFARDPGQRDFIPFHVADRSAFQGSPVLEGLLRVLGMVRGRVTAADVFDLLVLPPIAEGLGLDAAGIDTLRQWVVASGVRWGIDAEHRARAGLPAEGANTWRFGLRRLLLGYALPGEERRTFHDVLPFDEVEGKDAMLLGTLAGFARTLFGWLDELERPRTLEAWCGTVAALGAALFAPGADTERELSRVARALEDSTEDARAAGFDRTVSVQVIASLLASVADSAGAHHGFLSGGVTFCAMVPMRSIPFRVVALLGMNDGEFPRAPRPIEFDLAHSGKVPRRPGDRSRREDDQYLFLETLCAAREKLIITYTGQSARDDRARPPSVCVAELLDALGERCLRPPGMDARRVAHERFVVKHPLQGFSPRYFSGAEPRLFSYSTSYARAARNLTALRGPARAFLGSRLPVPDVDVIRLEDLTRFFRSPPAWFLNRRLGLYLKQEDVALPEREPLELDALADWKLGTRLLEHRLAGISVEESERLLRAAGELPHGCSGTLALEGHAAVCEAIAAGVREARGGGELPPLDVEVALPSKVRVVGSVSGRWRGGLVTHTYSSLKAKHELEAWIRHVAACATPGGAARSWLVGRAGSAEKVVAWEPLDEAQARQVLERLAQRFRAGLAAPLRFLPETSWKYFVTLGRGAEKALAEAVKAYDGDHGDTAHDPHPRRAFDEQLPPFDAEWAAGRRALEDTEFHQVALEVFAPLEAAKVQGRRA